jgi:hypothetical protein
MLAPKHKMKTKKPTKNRILIEPLLFGDYYVAIYDERNELLLDKKYFTSGYNSAILVAAELRSRKEWKDLAICIFDGKNEKKLN